MYSKAIKQRKFIFTPEVDGMTHAFSIVCRAPPSTPVVCGTNTENNAASASFAEKLSTNCDFQQFSYNKELTKPEDVKEVTVHSYWIPKEKAERAILSNFTQI